MPHEIFKRVAVSSDEQARGRPPALRRPPPDVLEAGVRRLRVVAMLVAVLTLVLTFAFRHVNRLLQNSSPPLALWLVPMLIGEILSFAIFVRTFSRGADPETTLDLGLVYEVLIALVLSVNHHVVSYASSPPRGWTTVAVWVLAFPLLIPTTRGKALLATVSAAAMDPFGLIITVAAGNPLPSPLLLVQIFLPTAAAAVAGLVLSGIVSRMSTEVGEAREMGSYRLVELLGQGGMGEVWLAEHRLLARPSAIKLITPDRSRSANRDLSRRFEREARATAGLRSPHTVQIYDFGTTEDGTFYYVMELLEGYDLETLVTRFGRQPPSRVAHFLRQACDSLAEAHSLGLVHRDVKPANIYACRYGLDLDFVKLLDFGLVKSVAQDFGGAGTRTGVVAGSPHSMAPEIARGEGSIDGRADIYGLGCVGYRLLTGQHVFDGASPVQIILDHLNTAPTPPSRRAGAPIPAALERIVLSCLEKDPNQRPASAVELGRAIGETGLAQEWTRAHSERWWKENFSEPRRAPGETSERSTEEVPQGTTRQTRSIRPA
jgi:serine/threonine-protein kinase